MLVDCGGGGGGGGGGGEADDTVVSFDLAHAADFRGGGLVGERGVAAAAAEIYVFERQTADHW